jgi:hypothetical protein
MKTPHRFRLAFILTLLASASAPLRAQHTVSLANDPIAASLGPLTLAGDLVENEFVPRTEVTLSIEPSTPPPPPLGSFDIVINAGAALAGNAAALAAFNRAALAWEARIADPITINISANLASLGPSILGSTSSVVLQASYATIRDQMVLDAADELDDLIVGSLPTAAEFSATIPGGTLLSGNLSVSKANAKALGFGGLDVSFGLNDATINFSSDFAFDFDNSDGVGAGLIDFETVAAHEIGHALGFSSFVDSVNAGATTVQLLTLDLFRFANNTAADPTTSGEFTNFARNLVPGVDAVTDEIFGSTPEYRMSTGLTNVAFPGTDGRQASHWKADELTSTFIGLLDPTLSAGQFYGPQNSDFRALDLIGYEIVSVPEPASVWVALSLFGLAARREHRRQLTQRREARAVFRTRKSVA